MATSVQEAPVNFFGGSPLNRLSWLRTSEPFLNAIVEHQSTQWILFKGGSLLISTPEGQKKGKVARLSTPEVRSVLGAKPYFAQTQKEGEIADSSISVLEAARIRGPSIVFLGLHENDGTTSGALPSSDFSKRDAGSVAANVKGEPYFSLDLTGVPQQEIDWVLKNAEVNRVGEKLAFIDTRTSMSSMDDFAGGIVAEAKAMVEWNTRNKFCASCGSPVYSTWAGWKLACTSVLPWADLTGRTPCPTAVGVHNQSHPRTDPVVIMAVVNESNDKVLLGRNRKWPGRFYSALAGFIEPGESFEDAVRRELWEEAGLKVWGVRYHSTQPWPFPASLMIGFYAIADESLPTRTDLDNELEDARWYTREEILDVLAHPLGTRMADPRKEVETTGNEPPFRLPPLTAIAGVLVSDWAHRRVVITGPDLQVKGNL
ncbi:NUDIX hydrolase domain-like protein [Irpex rosettiformis]|uniref:NUDIX hydrolase domain-like protein n=1 Tax=Irpex rosettiformis TaxID=378272 RepID=A0ACB8U1A8_9APHY|nr:NUDIX hydrolase domain-like protein [Irpex rosettiformis]